jgi:threonylcarbamoyladenosine tRNA methylthiotransferase MtaB
VKYAIVTFGCRVNQADSLGFEEDLLASGASAASPDDADLVVVNTCSVTASADQGARQTIRRIARANPNARIVVTGCYATRQPADVASLPNVVRIIPNGGKSHLVSDALTTAERFGDGDGSCGARIEPGVAGRTAFTLRVQTGCAEVCSYCIIPSTRGRPTSAPLADVLNKVERVTDAGFKEIVLTGVHLGSYGRDLSPRTSLFELLTSLAAMEKDALFRISSLEPMDCSRDVVDLVASSRSFAPHFHLPLQHASNRMLSAMGRPYTISYYSDLVEHVRRRLPAASIGSDVIVGFPGETGGDFAELSAYLESSPLTHLHVFPYSNRPGTRASSMSGAVSGPIVRQRSAAIRAVSQRLTARFNQAQIGTIRRGLTLEDGRVVVTDNYMKLRVGPGRRRNEWVRVRVVSDHDGELLAG